MEGSIALRPAERKTLLDYYRRHGDPAVRLRAHIILLLADGYSWSLITAVLFCSSRTISRWKRRFKRQGVTGLLGEVRGVRSPGDSCWIAILIGWVTTMTPRAFGFLRSRWCCEALVLVFWQVHRLPVSRETVRRWLHRGGLVWRRPRPVLKPKDPRKPAILRKLRQLLRDLPDDEIAVWQDEVDINSNPKIGSMWMQRGRQALILTPGTNDKRYLAGSLNWRTGDLIVTEGYPHQGRNADLFIRHLDDLRTRLRRYQKIHVICDNASAHDCRKVNAYLAKWGDRIVLHYLPTYAPELNPIERVWWHLHEEITRNHRCRDLEELLDLVFDWLHKRKPFAIEGSIYPRHEPVRRQAA